MQKLHRVFLLSAVALAGCTGGPDTPAGNDVIVTASRIVVGPAVVAPRDVVRGDRRGTVKILKRSGAFQAEISCDDVTGLLAMASDSAQHDARLAAYVDGVRQDHVQIMQAPESQRPRIAPVLRLTFSAVDGPLNQDDATDRAYRHIAQLRMARTADEYRRAHVLCGQ